MLSERARACALLGAALLPLACSRELPAERASDIARETQGVRAAPLLAASGARPAESPPSVGHGVAVVELFTSEGCSSCPPADRVLARLAARAKAGSLPIFPLSFHVDYWNYLGWRDRFSDAGYSERQRGYGGISASGGTYTPQAVINGQAECVGSDAARIDSLVGAALGRTSPNQIALEAKRGEHGIEVSYRVEGERKARVLNLALVEPRAESQVERGENAGEHLAHVNVVRAFSSRPLTAEGGTWALPAQPELAARRLAVVAYVQAPAQGDVSGASALELQ